MKDGMRCALFFCDVGEESQFLEVHEPLFTAMGALVYDAPALTWEDMAKAWKALQEQEPEAERRGNYRGLPGAGPVIAGDVSAGSVVRSVGRATMYRVTALRICQRKWVPNG